MYSRCSASPQLGAGLFPHVVGKALIGFIEQSARFLKGVFPGDTLYPMLEITTLTPQRTTGIVVMRSTLYNQDQDQALDGEHKYMLRLNNTQT
jgi:acyl dehydratase